MLFTMTMVMALVLTVVGYLKRISILTFLAAGAWIAFSVQCYTLSTTPSSGHWDVYYALFFLGAFACLASAFMPALQHSTPKEEKGDIALSDIDQTESENDKLWAATQVPRIGRRGYVARRKK